MPRSRAEGPCYGSSNEMTDVATTILVSQASAHSPCSSFQGIIAFSDFFLFLCGVIHQCLLICFPINSHVHCDDAVAYR